MKRLEAIGAFGAELECVANWLGVLICALTPMKMLGMGAGPRNDEKYLPEEVLGCTDKHKPLHAKTNRNFVAEYVRLQSERIVAFRELIVDVNSGGCPHPQHSVPMPDAEFDAFTDVLGQ